MGGLLMETLNMNRNMREIVLPKSEQKSFCAMAFDGCHFHFLVQGENNIYKYNQKFERIDVMKTNRALTGICYDSIDGCFWGIESRSEDAIFKFNNKFIETEIVRLKNYTKQNKPALGVSHDVERNTLVLSYQNTLFEVSKQGDHRPVLFKDPCVDIINHVTIAPYHAVAKREARSQWVGFFDRRGQMTGSLSIPSEYIVGDILHYPCHDHTDFDLMVLVSKPCHGQSILLYEMKNICIHGRHYDICRKDCKKEERCTGGRRRHAWDLIESTATVEASIANILNAESEKLQKAVKLADSIEELLEINNSINKTIINITQLEYILYSTLQFTGEILGESCGDRERRRTGCEQHKQ